MIVVFGSLIADVVFPVHALPRPGETVACDSTLLTPGGKGANQAVAAARVGATVRMAGCIGDDRFASLLQDSLSEAGIATEALRVIEGESSGCAAVAVDRDGHNQIVLALGANRHSTDQQVPDDWLGPETCVLLQMEVPVAANWRLIARAKARGARTILNFAPAGVVPAAVLEQVDVFVVNEMEAEAVAEALALDDRAPEGVARWLARQFKLDCIVTLGADGARLCRPNGELWQVAALPIVAVDTTGAGDAFVGVFAAALDAGRDVPDALHRASIAGGLACLAAGAQSSFPDGATIETWHDDLALPRLV